MYSGIMPHFLPNWSRYQKYLDHLASWIWHHADQSHFLLPLGGAMTIIYIWHVHVIIPHHWTYMCGLSRITPSKLELCHTSCDLSVNCFVMATPFEITKIPLQFCIMDISTSNWSSSKWPNLVSVSGCDCKICLWEDPYSDHWCTFGACWWNWMRKDKKNVAIKETLDSINLSGPRAFSGSRLLPELENHHGWCLWQVLWVFMYAKHLKKWPKTLGAWTLITNSLSNHTMNCLAQYINLYSPIPFWCRWTPVETSLLVSYPLYKPK